MRRGSRLLCLLAAIVAAAALVPATAAPAAQPAPSPLEASILRLLNVERAAHGLVPLTLSLPLTAAASQHSHEMVDRGYFAHESAGGGPFWKRVARYYAEGRFGFWSVGENLAWSSPDIDARRALDLWLASPHHRENILAPRWREIGISAVHARRAPGAYGGRDVTVVTTDFGIRR